MPGLLRVAELLRWTDICGESGSALERGGGGVELLRPPGGTEELRWAAELRGNGELVSWLAKGLSLRGAGVKDRLSPLV
jgi:hypothetical protein